MRLIDDFSLKMSRFTLVFGLTGVAAVPAQAQRPSPDSSKIYTYVARMPVYPGGRGYLVLLADLRREFRAASGAAGCAVPTSPVNVNLLVGPSGVIYKAEFVNNLPPAKATAGSPSNVADTPTGPALPAACEAALTAAIRKLPRLQPGVQNGVRQTVRITLPLVPKSTP
jgi:hypothetical protein